MQRVIFHWTGGTHEVSNLDREHYHFIVDGRGGVHAGKHAVINNARPVHGRYAAHTLGCNTGSIGISMAAMLNGVESPYNPGKFPLTKVQFEAAAQLVARLCKQYKIEVTRKTVLSHAEVQPTLGIRQRGKWDITRLPWDASIKGAIPCGDAFRALVKSNL
jgi:N-acetyl-anhydromuramyl-L-alanine amidase AmpD